MHLLLWMNFILDCNCIGFAELRETSNNQKKNKNENIFLHRNIDTSLSKRAPKTIKSQHGVYDILCINELKFTLAKHV